MRECRYTPGDLPAIVTSRLVLVFAGVTAASTARAVLALAPHDPGLETVLDAIVAPGIANAPDFVAVSVPGDGTLTAIARGALRLEVQTTDDVQALDAAGARTWREATFAGAVSFGIAGADWPGAPLAASGHADRVARPGPLAISRLVAHLDAPLAPPPLDPGQTLDFAEALRQEPVLPVEAVRAPGPALRADVAAGLEALQSSPGRYDELFGATINFGVEAAAVRADDEVSADAAAAGSAPDRGDLPPGVPALVGRCGHANPVERTECVVCGSPLAGGAVSHVTSPDLGALVLPDGAEVPLGGVVLVGRSPRGDRGAGPALPTLVTIDDRDVSRTHVRIRSEGWRVLIEDLDSTNGTLLIGADGAPRRLRAGEPAIIVDGTIADLGGTQLRFTRIP